MTPEGIQPLMLFLSFMSLATGFAFGFVGFFSPTPKNAEEKGVVFVLRVGSVAMLLAGLLLLATHPDAYRVQGDVWAAVITWLQTWN